MTSFQTSYDINPDIGFPGELARPSEPHATASGIAGVGGAGFNGDGMQPGDPVFYDRVNDRFRAPLNDTQFDEVCGILGYRKDTVAESDATVEIGNGEEIQFFTFGTVWVTASEAMRYGDKIHWDAGTHRWGVEDYVGDPSDTDFATAADTTWNAGEVTLVNALRQFVRGMRRYPIVCVSRAPVAAGGMAMAQIGYGRTY